MGDISISRQNAKTNQAAAGPRPRTHAISTDLTADPSARGVGISERLLILTILFVMLASILIYAPSLANFRDNWLNDRLAAARTAALLFEISPPDTLPDATVQQLLQTLQVKTVTIKIGGARRLVAATGTPDMIDRQFDLRMPMLPTSIMEAFDTLLMGGHRTINVVGPAPMGGDFVDIVIDEAPLREAMLRFSRNMLLISLLISAVTGALLYLAMLVMIVRPVSRLVSSIVRFARTPEDKGGIIVLSGRSDEIGRAEEALHGMQTALAKQLKQKTRLARLGLAVSKINHDLRNMLASVQLFSDRLAGVPDPTVQRFAPKLIAALDRAINFCQATLTFGKAEEAPPKARLLRLAPLVDEVRETLGAGDDGTVGVGWMNDVPQDLNVCADPDHLFRILLNLGRNAIQALGNHDHTEGWRPHVTVRAANEGGFTRIDVADNGPGVPARLRGTLFEAFAGSDGKGSTGLGLAIAADLARAHGGSITLLCEDDPVQSAGATFRVTLPQSPS